MPMHTPDDFYGRFIEPIEDRMIRSVWRITRNAQDAEDAMQSALMEVWKRRHRIIRHAVPPALILEMCADAACSVARRRARDRRRTEPANPDDEPIDAARSPWMEMAHRELTDEILAAIRRLSHRQAVAITLRVFEALPYEQIAAAMDCTEATARKHVVRARAHLQIVLAKHHPSRLAGSGP
jgi:RNA polymerase sigma-70 factor (ECF subfamily)